jgi:hypothetical protein
MYTVFTHNFTENFAKKITKELPVFSPDNLEVSYILLERERERERERETIHYNPRVR